MCRDRLTQVDPAMPSGSSCVREKEAMCRPVPTLQATQAQMPQVAEACCCASIQSKAESLCNLTWEQRFGMNPWVPCARPSSSQWALAHKATQPNKKSQRNKQAKANAHHQDLKSLSPSKRGNVQNFPLSLALSPHFKDNPPLEFPNALLFQENLLSTINDGGSIHFTSIVML